MWCGRAMAALSLVLALSTFIPAAAAKRRRVAVPTLAKKLRKSRSVGYAWRGRLRSGVLASQSDQIRHVTEYREHNNFYGTWEMVQLLQRAAHRVSRRMPGARLNIGELSRPRGGQIAGHSSHESGRDVDIGFYMLDANGRPYDTPFAFAAFDDRGQALPPNRGLVFDAARNWQLIAKLVTDGDARVQFAFVSPGLKRLLLAEGKRQGASRVVLNRAAHVMARPSGRHPHNNHFHLRIYCGPRERPGCVDRPPYWPWYPGTPPPLTPVR